MNILAIETSGRRGSVAALLGETSQARLIRQFVLGDEQRTAQALAPALRDLLAAAGWSPQSVGLIAVTVGPGSFTGLRIGVTTAKSFAYATRAEVLAVNTLSTIAAQAPPSPGRLWAVIDAQRQELFSAQFAGDASLNVPIDCDASIVRQDAWLAELKPGDRVIGPPMRQLAERLPDSVELLSEDLWQPMAATVGAIGWRAYQAGHRGDVWKLAPNYYRPSYAEEKRARSKEREAKCE